MRERSESKRNWSILGTVFAVLLVSFVIYIIAKYAYESKQYEKKEFQYIYLRQKTEKLADPTEAKQEDEENPPLGGRTYDFEALRAENKDIIAWLYLPYTNIDYPIFWSEDNTYYLEHNMDGSKGRPGCLYMESYNQTDFSDPLSIIYGHNMRNGTMFGTLKEFRDATYFNEHRSIYLYTPDGEMEYLIIAASLYSDEHLLADQIAIDESGAVSFRGMVGNEGVKCMNRIKAYGDKQRIYGSDEESTVREGDKLLVLSTCSTDRQKRLLIVGKLVNSAK